MESTDAPARLRSRSGWLIERAAATAHRELVAGLGRAGANRHQHALLAALGEFGALSQADLGRRCGVDPSDVTGALADLEAAGFVRRGTDPQDRRRNLVTLPAKGRRRLERLDTVVERAQQQWLAPLSDAERRQLARLLTKLAAQRQPT